MLDQPLLSGLVFGLVTYFVMNLSSCRCAFHAAAAQARCRSARSCSRTSSLVGLPTALIAKRYLRRQLILTLLANKFALSLYRAP